MPSTPLGSSGLHLQALHPFPGLRPVTRGSAPSCLLAEKTYDAAGFASCYGPVACTRPRRVRPRASTPTSRWTLAGCYKGGLAPPLAGLPPASRHELSGRTVTSLRGRL